MWFMLTCVHNLQDDEQWGVCCNISCVKAKVSHHTKCLTAHRGQVWPFLNKASCFLDLSVKWWLKCVFFFFFFLSFFYDLCAAVSDHGCCCHQCCLKQVTFSVIIWDIVIWVMFSFQLCVWHLSSIFSSLSCRSVAISSSTASLCHNARGNLLPRT